jgi:hypothetical protein
MFKVILIGSFIYYNNNVSEGNITHCIGLSIKPRSVRSIQYCNWEIIVLLLAPFGILPIGHVPD